MVAGFMVDALFTDVDVQAQLEQALPRGRSRRRACRRRAHERWRTSSPTRPAAAEGAEALGGGQPERATRSWSRSSRTGRRAESRSTSARSSTSSATSSGWTRLEAPARRGPDHDVGSDQLSGARKGVSCSRRWRSVLLRRPGLFGLAIYLAAGWRREALRKIGFAFILVGLLVLVIRGLGGDALTESLALHRAVEPAVSATWEIGTSLLCRPGRAAIFYGLLIVIGAWLAAPRGHRPRRPASDHARPGASRDGLPALGVLLLLLFWWARPPASSGCRPRC